MENILISGKSPAKYRVAETLVRNRTDVGDPVLLIDFEWRNRLLPGASQATLGSFLGYLNAEELVWVYQTMAEAHDLRVSAAAMSRLLTYLAKFYQDHDDRLTVDELRTLDLYELKEQVRLSGDARFLHFLTNHEMRLGEVEDAIVHISESLGGEPLARINPDLALRIEGPVDEEDADAKAFMRLMPSLVRGLLADLASLGAYPLVVIQGTPYQASSLISKLTALEGADFLVVSNDIFGIEEVYQSCVLSCMDKCMVYNHVLESSAEKWARKLGIHPVRRAAVSQAQSGGTLGQRRPALMTPRNMGAVGAVDMGRSNVVVTTEDRLKIRADEIVNLRPDECICIDQRTGEYRRI